MSVHRCIVCGRIVRDPSYIRKTCCVNKVYMFCSNECRNRWSSMWLKSQVEQRYGTSRRSDN